MKKWTAIVTMGVLAGCNNSPPEQQAQSAVVTNYTKVSSPALAATPKTENPRLGRCYMESCSWSIENARSTVRKTNDGELIQLTLLGGTSADGGTIRQPKPIKWNKKPHTAYVLCSKKLPTVISSDLQVDILNFPDGVPGVLESSASLYMASCHGVTKGSFGDAADRLGYTTSPIVDEIQITKPSDIFNAFSKSAKKPSCPEKEDYGRCFYDSGWRPATNNSAFSPLGENDVPSGAGCWGEDSKGNMIVGNEFEGPVAIRIRGKLIKGSGSNEAIKTPSGILRIVVSNEVAFSEGGAINKALLVWEPTMGKSEQTEIRFGCGA